MPSIIIKTADELARQRHAGQLLASVFDMLDTFIVPGVTTMAINDRVEDFIVNQLHARPASKGQYDFPYVLNTSINDVVCHGIPKATEHLRAGMIVNVDITLEKAGMIADSSKMYLIGDVSPLARRLVKTTYEAMWKGIEVVKPGATLGDIGHAIQRWVEEHGYSVVREYCGHGVGQKCMRNRRCCITAAPEKAPCCRKAWCSPLSRWSTRATAVSKPKKMAGRWLPAIKNSPRNGSTPWPLPPTVLRC